MAVKRHVCRSFGMASNKYDSSGAKVGVNSRSASSRTCVIVSRASVVILCQTYQELDSGQVPLSVITSQKVNYTTWGSDDNMWTVTEFYSLSYDVHAADYYCRSEVKCSTEHCELFGYLESKLSGQGKLSYTKLDRTMTYRVGVRTNAKIPYGSTDSLWIMGKAKAIVFPEPVFAFPMQSLPCI